MPYTPLPSLLQTYKPFNELESLYVQQLKQFLADSPNPYHRDNLVCHTVADAWVVSPDRTQVLMLVHGDSGIWLAPGGHTDGSPDMLGAAVRELEEETGLTLAQAKPLLGGTLFDINVGLVPDRMKKSGLVPAHMHFDICFAFEADPATTKLTISDESLDLAWCPVKEARERTLPCHHRRVDKTLAGLLG